MLELIEDLSPEQQQVLTLKFVFNFSNGEAATILGKTEGAMKSLQHRALASLAEAVRALRRHVGSRLALSVGIVGLPSSGKTTLFNALTRTGAPLPARSTSAWRRSRTSGSSRLAAGRRAQARSRRPPFAWSTSPAPGPAAARQPAPGRRAARRPRRLSGRGPRRRPRDAAARAAVADRDHVERRLERVAKQAKSGDARLREEVDAARGAARAPRGRRPLSEWPGELPPELEPLTTKPLIAVENGPAGSTSSSRPSCASCPRRRPPRSGRARRRSARSRAGS